jgi:DNA processing protein
MSWVPNLLIKQGAKLVQTAEDVLAELLPEDRRRAAASRPRAVASPLQATLGQGFTSEITRSISARLAVDAPTHIDTLMEDLPQYSSSELIAALFELEMAGTIRQLAGKQYIKVW